MLILYVRSFGGDEMSSEEEKQKSDTMKILRKHEEERRECHKEVRQDFKEVREKIDSSRNWTIGVVSAGIAFLTLVFIVVSHLSDSSNRQAVAIPIALVVQPPQIIILDKDAILGGTSVPSVTPSE